MSYAIARQEKMHAPQVAAMQYHNNREEGYHSNPDIDPERTHLNEEIRACPDYAAAIEKRIAEGYTGKRKPRSDAVKLVEVVFTASPEFFQRATKEQEAAFFADAMEFARAEFGDANIIHATVHRDETTPHMHLGYVPLTNDGRLSAKEVVGNREDMQVFQDRWHEQVGKKYDLQRGEKRENIRHLDVQEFKAETLHAAKQELVEVEQSRERMESLKVKLGLAVMEKSNELESLTQQVAQARAEAVEARQEAQKATQERDSAKEDVSTLKTEIRGLQDERDGLEDALEPQRREILANKREISELVAERGELEAATAAARTDYGRASAQLDALNRQIDERVQANERVQEYGDKLESRVSRLEAALERVETKFRHIFEVVQSLDKLPFWGSWRENITRIMRENPLAQRIYEAGRPWKTEKHAVKAEKQAKREVTQAVDEIKEERRSINDLLAEATRISEEQAARRQPNRSRGHDGHER